jgi:hypothetical protein
MGNLNNYLKEHPNKRDSFILANIGGFEWQILRDQRVYSSLSINHHEPDDMIAINNNDKVEDHEALKKKVVAVLRQKIHQSIEDITGLAMEAGYKDFEITYEEIIDMLGSTSMMILIN